MRTALLRRSVRLLQQSTTAGSISATVGGGGSVTPSDGTAAVVVMPPVDGIHWPQSKEGEKARWKDSQDIMADGHNSKMAKQIGHRADTATRVRNMALRQTGLNEHFLLTDLDFERDAIIFGNTREEFEANVNKVKKLVIDYQRWETNDTYYLWATRFLQAFCLYIIVDVWEQIRLKAILCASWENYKQYHEERLSEIERERHRALRCAEEHITRSPPTFTRAVLQAAASSSPPVTPLHPMDTAGTEKEKRRLMVQVTGNVTHEAEATSDASLRVMRRILLPQSSDYITAVKEQMMDHQKTKYDALNFPKVAIAAVAA